MNEATRNRTVTGTVKDLTAYGALAYTAYAVVRCGYYFVDDAREIRAKRNSKIKNEK